MDDAEVRILVLGDGDFTYSTKLLASVEPSSITATVYLSEEELIAMYCDDVFDNVKKLKEAGVNVMFSVDATDLPTSITDQKYDSVHFNFPHTGGKSKINENRKLLVNTFKSLKGQIKESGNIEISLLPGQGGTPADESKLRSKGNNWSIQDAAAQSDFILYNVEKFDPSFYNLTGYRGRSGAFLCTNGLRHKFISQPFRHRSLKELLTNKAPDSYLGVFLKENHVARESLALQYNTILGSFEEVFSIMVDENNQEIERSSKRMKLSETKATLSIDQQVVNRFGLKHKKSIFYPSNHTCVLYPPTFTHDVSIWTGSLATPNIVPVLLGCLGTAFQSVSKKEPAPYFNEKTQKYSHCLRVAYSHPFEALSESLVKHIAHNIVRERLTASGFELH